MRWIILIMAVVVGFAAVGARADDLSDLQAKFKDRYPHLLELKKSGTVGEVVNGMVEFVHPDTAAADAKTFVQAENDQRAQLYKLIAQQQGTTAEEVAKTSALRHFDKANPGDWLKGADGAWKQK